MAEKAQADESSIIIGIETDATGSPVSNRADMVQRRYGATEISIDEDSEKVSSEELRAQYAETFGELASLWGTGSFTMQIPEGEGFLPIAQAVLGDQSPVSTAIGNKTVLPAGTPLTKHVISGESLIGQADKQILDTLGRFAQAATLRITLTSAALIAVATPGTVVVRYDVNGTETDLTATFANTVLTTPQTVSLPANAKVVRLTTTGFNAGTLDVEAVVVIVDGHDLTTAAVVLSNNLSTYNQAFNARVQLASATGAGTVTFTYTVNGGAAQTVVLTFATGALTDPQFAPIPANATIAGIAVAGFTAGTADIDAVFPLLETSFFDNNDTLAVGVVRAQDLTATIAVADDLATYTGAHTLTVSPSEDATATTDGTVTIVYTTDGTAHSGVLTFASGALTTAQTFDLPADSTITDVATSGWTDGELDITAPISGVLVYGAEFEQPGRARFTFTDAKPNGQIRIKGLRKVGIATKDWLHLDEDLELDATGTVVVSTKYFRNIINAEVLDEDGNLDVSGTFTLTSEPTKADGTSAYKTLVKVADRVLDNYTLEPEVGGIPRLVERAKFVGATIDNADTLTVACDILAGRVDHERSVESGFGDAFVATAEQHPTEFPFLSTGFFTGRGGYLEINGDALIFDSAPVTIGHNYDFDTEKSGSIFRVDPERQGRRTVTMAVSAKYEVGTSSDDVTLRWQRLYRANAAVSVRLVQYRWDASGRQKALIWTLPYCEILSPVRVEATSPGSIPITINLGARPDPATTETAEITLEMWNDDEAA